MSRITESSIEKLALELLERQGYQCIYGPDIAPDSTTPERQSFEDVLLIKRLTAAVSRINRLFAFNGLIVISDEPEIAKHYTTKEQRRTLANRMKNPEDGLKLVIVRDMWLTGFDVPCLHTLYIDKPMKGHNLMQAIARVNRVYKDKKGGLIVDYLGFASDRKKALSFYSDSGGKSDPVVAQEKAVQLMLEKLEVVSQMFYGFAYEGFFEADAG